MLCSSPELPSRTSAPKPIFTVKKPFFYQFLLLALLTAPAWGQSEAGKQLVLQLPPGPNNPRNSEGDFVTLRNGRILFVYSHYTGTSSSDHAPAYLAARTSDDGGKTWSDQDRLVLREDNVLNLMSVSLLRLKNGRLALFYLKKTSEIDCIPMVRFSDDEAQTWSAPTACITDRQGYFVLNNSRVIQLDSGRLLMAVALHRTASDPALVNKGRLWSYFSDDNGRTWQSGPEVPNPGGVITQEPGVVELKGGRVMMFIRTDSGVQYLSYSGDGGKTWSAVEPSTIRSPLSPASIKRIPATGDLLLVWNDNREVAQNIRGKRTPLNVAISKDEGKTWVKNKVIEPDPDGWYCYTAIHFVGRDTLLGYCAGSQSKRTHLSVINVTRLSHDWLYE